MVTPVNKGSTRETCVEVRRWAYQLLDLAVDLAMELHRLERIEHAAQVLGHHVGVAALAEYREEERVRDEVEPGEELPLGLRDAEGEQVN